MTEIALRPGEETSLRFVCFVIPKSQIEIEIVAVLAWLIRSSELYGRAVLEVLNDVEEPVTVDEWMALWGKHLDLAGGIAAIAPCRCSIALAAQDDLCRACGGYV